MLPTIKRDGNLTTIYMDDRVLWFSYDTLVAFQSISTKTGIEKVVHENVWSASTGKHLNSIDGGDKESRVDHRTFHDKWYKLLGE